MELNNGKTSSNLPQRPLTNMWMPPNGQNANTFINNNNNAMNINILNNNIIDLTSPSTSPHSQRRSMRILNQNQNSPPSPMEGDEDN